MALPTGRWRINANGWQGELTILGIDGEGNLNAVVTFIGGGQQRVTGFWDDTSKKITFIRVVNENEPSQNQIYTGFHFTSQNPPGSANWLTGFFEAFQGGGGAAHRVLYGWYATYPVIE